MDDLLREAIADAKAVRETALANAKIALEEAFTPRLQSMLSKKIASEMEDKDETEDSEEMREEEDAEEEMEEAMHDKEEGEHEEGEHEEMRDADEMDAEEMRDADEMDAEEMRDAEEAMHDKEEGEHEEMRDAEEGEHEEGEHEEMRDKDEDEMEEAMHDKEETEDAEETDDVDEDELDLESVLAELEKDLDDEDKVDEEYNTDEVGDGMDKDEVETDEDKLAENDVSSDIGSADNKVNPEANDSTKSGAQGPEGEGSDKPAGKELGDHEIVDDLTEVEDKDEEDLDLDEVLRALTEEDKEEEDAEENEKLKAEIKEHRKVIHFMRSKLNEVNLLNAKLLFSNKLFRAFGLNNNQKLKVVETFDRTKNLREVKLVYATLAESFKKPSNRISESVKKGSASKPVRSTKPKAVLSEGAELKARFKKLANIL